MGRAKDIKISVIPSDFANDFMRKTHYSHSIVMGSKVHFGAFLDNMLHGVMSFGEPMDKRKVIGLVQPCLWNQMLELNRMAFDDYLPRNSESRCISIAIKLIKKKAPHIKWILSYSDATQCGDGTIYRAAGFKLTQIRKSDQIIELPNGKRLTKMSLTIPGSRQRLQTLKLLGLKDDGSAALKPLIDAGCRNIVGFQNRYIFVIDPNCRIVGPVLPYSAIDEAGAGMYKGIKTTRASGLNKSHDTSSVEMAVTPTLALTDLNITLINPKL